MNSRWISLKNKIKNNQKNNETKNKSKLYNEINSRNQTPDTFEEDKETKLLITKNNDIKEDYIEEDDYNYNIYNKPISKYKYFPEEEKYFYNTISTFKSFELKNKYLLLFNRNKKINRFNNNQYRDYINFDTNLNLSFQGRMKNNIFIRKKTKIIDKNKKFFNKIINIFDKNHIIMNNKQNKLLKNNRNIYYNKIKINYKYNYFKNKNISKFSKKNRKQLKKNFSSILETHLKVDSQNSNELIQKNNRIYKISEMSDKKSIDNEENIIQKKEDKNETKINNIKSVSKNLFNKNVSDNQSTSSKSNQLNKKEEEYEKVKNGRISNLYIGLNKRLATGKNHEDNSLLENNNNISNNNNNYNYKGRFRYSNRKSKSIIEDSFVNGNNNQNNISDNNDIIEKQTPKNLFQNNYDLQEENIIRENVKEKIDKKYHKRYMYINNNSDRKNRNINQNNKYNRENRDNRENRENKENKENNNRNKNEIKNNNSHINDRRGYYSNLVSKKNEPNASINNRRKNIPISAKDKNINISNNNNEISKNYNNNNNKKHNILEKSNTSEMTKIKLEKSIFHSSQFSSQMLPPSKKNNSNRFGSNILQNKDNNNNKKEYINYNKKEYYNYKNGYNRNNLISNERNKDNLINSKSYIKKQDTNVEDKKNNNYYKNILNSNNSQSSQTKKYISMIKPQINTDRIKGINTDRHMETKRTLGNEYEGDKYSIINNSTTKSSYNLNIIKYIREENNSSKNLHNYESNKENKYINKIINNIESKYNFKNENDNDKNKNCIPQIKHSNYFQRNNHKYHEIKSTSSDKDTKGEETDYNLFYNKVKSKYPQIMNSTSMDNIRGVVNRSKDKDINLRQIKTNRYDRIERK